MAIAAAVLLIVGLIQPVVASTTSDIAKTLHNLSKWKTPPVVDPVTGQVTTPGTLNPNSVQSTTETQLCVFCHTPHAATSSIKGPLWNRTPSSVTTYTRYTSSSLDATAISEHFTAQPGGSSLLCLSCHDGTVALGQLNNLKGQSANLTISGTNAGNTMPDSSYGANSGFTRRIGKDLANDHPISITYDDTVAAQDGELQRLTTTAPLQRDIATSGELIGIRSSGYKPLLPLEPTGPAGAGQIQCATCHDPHSIEYPKFLRASRFQLGTPAGASFSKANDIICLACHTKLGDAWAQSSHANPTVADEVYIDAASTVRGVPNGKKVWELACLNCHDTHTAQGSRRLLREGVTSTVLGTGAGSYQQGDTTDALAASYKLNKFSSIENTCYQCHTAAGTKIIGTATGTVPDINTAFTSASWIHMPITTAEQGNDPTDGRREAHDITNADFVETQASLGLDNVKNRHVECTDCHNPHRVRRSSVFYGTSATTGEGAKRTHNVGGITGNVASGVLRGATGVEPTFGSFFTVGDTGKTKSNWPDLPTGYALKKGDPGTSQLTDSGQNYLTREYQLCYKCHSTYANTADAFPALGNTGGGTASGNANGLTNYTNVAAEFGAVNATDPPSSGTDQGETGNSGTACGATYTLDCAPTPSPPGGTNNHRSWHPVQWPTGRDRVERGSASWNNLRAPYALADVGKLTMYCSDCHGSADSWMQGASLAATSATSGPDLTKTQGPHGSSKPFLLKGIWDTTVTPNTAATTNATGTICGRCHDPKNATSGFASGTASHSFSAKASRKCMACHIAVPHGWKNKAFLVNLNCVQTEGGTGYTSSCTSVGGSSGTVNIPPYYSGALLRINSWAKSGNWSESSCNGKDWMSSACGF